MEEKIIEILESFKLKNIVSYNLTSKTPLLKKMLIATLPAGANVRKLCLELKTELEKVFESEVYVEGEFSEDWVVFEIDDLTIELFSDEKREFYNLEKLWGGAKTKLSEIKNKRKNK